MLHQALPSHVRVLCVAGGFIAGLTMWEIAVQTGTVSSLLLPSPMMVAQTLATMLKTPSFWMDLGATVGTWSLGVVVGTLCGGALDSLSFDLLKTVGQFVQGYEVEACPLKLWERAILDGYTVFRQVRANNSGIVVGDRDARTIGYKPLL